MRSLKVRIFAHSIYSARMDVTNQALPNALRYPRLQTVKLIGHMYDLSASLNHVLLHLLSLLNGAGYPSSHYFVLLQNIASISLLLAHRRSSCFTLPILTRLVTNDDLFEAGFGFAYGGSPRR